MAKYQSFAADKARRSHTNNQTNFSLRRYSHLRLPMKTDLTGTKIPSCIQYPGVGKIIDLIILLESGDKLLNQRRWSLHNYSGVYYSLTMSMNNTRSIFTALLWHFHRQITPRCTYRIVILLRIEIRPCCRCCFACHSLNQGIKMAIQ